MKDIQKILFDDRWRVYYWLDVANTKGYLTVTDYNRMLGDDLAEDDITILCTSDQIKGVKVHTKTYQNIEDKDDYIHKTSYSIELYD